MRKLLRALAVCAVLVSPLAIAVPAQASSPWFDMVNNNSSEQSYTCLIDDQFGAGHQLIMNVNVCGDGNGTDFQLINKNVVGGVTTWEIADGIGCMNRSDSSGVYINSCIFGDSTEEWIQSNQSDGQHWENVHAGTNGWLNVDCNSFLDCPETVVAVSATNPWATPGS